MSDVNIFAVLVATVASFIFGAIWYSPVLFLKHWCHATGIDPNASFNNPAKVYGLTFIMTLVSVLVFAWLPGATDSIKISLLTALGLGIGIVAMSLGINYQFSKASIIHWLIDSGFHIGRLSIIGTILAVWH